VTRLQAAFLAWVFTRVAVFLWGWLGLAFAVELTAILDVVTAR
jgi:membrane-bound metal-dependent hydrolase YbcI (DUF457 family)